MTAKDLYELLVDTYGITPVILCELHSPCASPKKHRCEELLIHKLINFDDVKTKFYRGRSDVNGSSADGYTYQNDWFCFVELKGWKDYLKFNAKTSEGKIQKQADKYDLSKKYQDCVYICEQLTKTTDLFKDKKIAFFLVTDIETERSGISLIADDLNFLTTKTPSKEDFCNKSLKGRLDIMPEKISKFYVECRNFDKMINKLPKSH